MNKYLEKVALHPTYKGALIGSVLGAGAKYPREISPVDQRRYTKKERAARVATGAILGAGLGAYVGTTKHILDTLKRRANSGYRATVNEPLRKHFENMGAANFRTKAEANKHYKTMASKWHPDKPRGSHEKMQKLNQAWQKAKAHPDFEKLAQENKYIKYLDSNTFKKKVLTNPEQPTPKVLEKEREPGSNLYISRDTPP